MEGRVKRHPQLLTVFAIVFILMALPAFAATITPPQIAVGCGAPGDSGSPVTPSVVVQRGCVDEHNGGASLGLTVWPPNSGMPAAQPTGTPPESPAKTTALPAAPPPPPCGYYALTPEELASPWAWAGAEQANTGTLIPGRFLTTNSGFVEAGIPADKAGLGVQPYWYRCDGQ